MQRIFDPHVHMTSRTTDDYQRMAAHGVKAICEPSFWLGQPRTHVGTYEDYFLSLLGWEAFRASQFGIKHFCTIGLNPKEANNPTLFSGVLELMPLYLKQKTVVAIGEIGLDDQTPAEEKAMSLQIEMAIAHQLPILIHTPHRDKKRGTERCIAIVKESKINPELVLVDHNTEETVKNTLDHGYYAGHSLYPETKMDHKRMLEIIKSFGVERVIVNSAADWGISDPLMIPKLVALMKGDGISDAFIDQLVWKNPLKFFAQSGRVSEFIMQEPVVVDQLKLHQDNSVLRGQTPMQDLTV
jgi:predicted metal-dependent TIM-barrel fold hydrolase